MEGISRREALAGTGLVVLAGAAGLQARRMDAAHQAAAAQAPDWARLARALRGRLLRPGDTGYAAASVPYNHRYAYIRPEGVALCSGAADIAAALRWARHYGVPFAARSGGHSYGGYSASRGLVISTARMNSVRVNREAMTITVGAGARNADLYAGLAGTGVAVPSGRCPTVGVSGLLLGGGFGFASRHLGLTCDHLLETEVVTAAGEILRVTPRSHADLFWACQGGGGGNFGINTGYRLRATRVGEVSVYKLSWPWRQAATVLDAAQRLMSGAPDTLSCRVGLGVSGGGHATGGPPARTVDALGLYFGPSRELSDLLSPVRAAAWPSEQLIEDREYVAAQSVLARSVPAGRFASKSRFLASALPGGGVAAAIRWLERWPGSSNPSGAGVTIFAWGGRIRRVAPERTAFVHRDPAFLMDTETTWTARDSKRVVTANLDWLAGVYDALAGYGMRQAYQNFIDPSLADWKKAYYGENLPRLVRVKRRYDPDDAFRFAQSIPEKLR
jgi:FAD/FMN-containing dehydrogenase